MITTHQYLEKYPIPVNSEKLILGTIHPHDHEKFEIPFFYGNVLSLWTILSDAFPKELQKPITLDGILSFLKNRKIAISDTIKVCKRNNPTALDKDLTPLELNTRLIEDIRNSNIKEVLCTSGFQKNNAFRLFYSEMLGLKITKEIKLNRELILDDSYFGKPIKLTILYSPSGSSNVGLSKCKDFLENQHDYAGVYRPVYKYKVDYYRKKFSG